MQAKTVTNLDAGFLALRVRNVGRMKGKFPNGLALAMKKVGIGPTSLAEKANTNKQNISRWADQERKLTPLWATRLAPLLHTTPAALLLIPDGDSFDTSDAGSDDAETESRTIPEIDVAGHGSYGGGVDASGEWAGGDSGNEADGHKPVAKWGFPETYIESELSLSYGSIDIIRIEGPSMDDGSNYSLRDGDRVLINRKNRAYRQGGVFAVWDGDGVIIKQVEPIRGSDPPAIRCTSLNKSYEPFELLLDGNAHIIGRVALKISRM